MKKRKIGKRILKLLIGFILFILAYSLGVSSYEAHLKSEKLKEFKERAYESYEVTLFDDKFIYHKVKRVHEWELNDPRDVFYDVGKTYPGQAGDVLLAFHSPFPYMPVVHEFLTFTLGGHAALVTENNKVIQSTGLTSNGQLDIGLMFEAIFHRGYDNENRLKLSAQKVNNYWITPHRNPDHKEYPYYGKYYRPEFYAVRLKYRNVETMDDHLTQIIDYAESKVNRALYNYLFIFDTQDKFYCTDLVTRAFLEVNVSEGERSYNLDPDGFIPSDYDILLSDDVYITIFKETIRNDQGEQEIHIYYLEDLEV